MTTRDRVSHTHESVRTSGARRDVKTFKPTPDYTTFLILCFSLSLIITGHVMGLSSIVGDYCNMSFLDLFRYLFLFLLRI